MVRNSLLTFFAAMLLLCIPYVGNAQKLSVATNLLDCINLGTINAESSYALSQHFSANAGIRYNNWSFRSADPFQNKVRSFSAGIRYWPWNTYSSFWLSVKGIAEEFNRGGLYRDMKSEEGKSLGVGVGAGYSLMLSAHFNLDFGVGIWTGRSPYYRQYSCPKCGRITYEGSRSFILPSEDTRVALVYVF